MQMLASMTWGQWLVALLIIVVCCFFMLIILLQRGRGGGLAGAFGGAGGSSAFGAKTGDVFTWITVVVATVLLVICIVANFMLEPRSDEELFSADTTAVPSPETTAPPADSQIAQSTYPGNVLSIHSPHTTLAAMRAMPRTD